MLKRKIYDKLLEFKNNRLNNKVKEALLIKGARQVGKSSIVIEFGKKEYKSFIEMNFILNPELKEIFNGSKNASDIYLKMSMYFSDFKIIENDTLIFLDEIQNCGAARTALKFLAMDNRCDVIASGSLLGLEYGEDADINVEVAESIPVGYERCLLMHSLDFEEYLWAKGYDEEKIDYLRNCFKDSIKVPDIINIKMLELFREFMVIGGMPEVVNTFINTLNYNEAFKVQDKIISDYNEDIAKHAKGEQKIKVKACFESIPRQLSKELKKFQYSVVEKGQTKRKYKDSVKWLKDSSIVNASYNVYEPYLPLLANQNVDAFKLYLNDTGLLTEIYGRATKQAIIDDSIKGNARGAVYENVIAECLVKRGYKLNYYKPDDNHELEFLIENENGVIPVEVKAGNNSSISLNNFIKDYKPKVAYKIIKGNLGCDGIKKIIPHYMIMFL